jgi:hypothetical protein
VGTDRPERRGGAVREFLAAKQNAERRLAKLELPWPILRFGQLTDDPGNGRIDPVVRAGTPPAACRDVAALAITEALARPQLGCKVVKVVDGDEAKSNCSRRQQANTAWSCLACGKGKCARPDSHSATDANE